MPKAQLCYRIDGIAMFNLAVLAATGFLLEFRLPPGSGGEHAVRVGSEAGRHLTVWELSRHEWSNIHFWLALTFLALMGAHLLLHWKWIRALAVGNDPDRQALRTRRFLIFVGLVLLIVALPWWVPVKEKQRRRIGTANAGTRWEGAWHTVRQVMDPAGLLRHRLPEAPASAGADDTGSDEPEGGNDNAGS